MCVILSRLIGKTKRGKINGTIIRVIFESIDGSKKRYIKLI